MADRIFFMESIEEGNKLFHYGTPRHSGRYPWGSGKNPYQHSRNFLSKISELRAQGLSDTEIVEALGLRSTGQLRAQVTIANAQKKSNEITRVRQLRQKGYSTTTIADMVGISEATVRNYLKPEYSVKATKTQSLAEELITQVDRVNYLDVGKGVELQLGVSQEQLKAAISLLEEQGYKVQYLRVPQATNKGQYTSVKVLTKDDVSWTELNENQDKVRSPAGVYFEDNGLTKRNIQYPESIKSDRVAIRYNEEGGVDKDGVIEIRPGVADLSLGNDHYAQVRIAVDGTHYLKGMAIYSNDLPEGVDIRFNTNKHIGTDKMKVLKELSEDPDNPFGSTIRRQRTYIGEDGKEHLSPVNIVNDEEEWGRWAKTLSAQYLSKQPVPTAKRQLDITYQDYKDQFDQIAALENPTVKRKLLESFAEDCDSAAVHLKAKGMPDQNVQVILPVNSLKDTEVYAPNYQNGERVVLIRYPHAGYFESPLLTVNNKNKEGKEIVGPDAKKAIGINKNVADQLSGADFDGDTVTVIPVRNNKLRSSNETLPGLKNYDPKEVYANPPDVPTTKERGFNTQLEMGKISNLINDMNIKGAPEEDLVRAVKHSMTVIDAEKHNLNYEKSYEDNGIAALKKEYQDGGGASTLISRAKSRVDVPEVKDFRYTEYTDKLGQGIDPETGKKIYKQTNRTYEEVKVVKDPEGNPVVNPETGKKVYESTGKTKTAMTETTKMAATDDANTLSSGTMIETVYADYANKMKALGNEARKEYVATPKMERNSSAAKTYAAEVESLEAKLTVAELNAPKERQAQMLANTWVSEALAANPTMSKSEESKVRQQFIASARARSGVTERKDRAVTITDKEWEAIQAGAVSDNTLMRILNNTDLADIQKRATPRSTTGVSAAELSRARNLLNAGYTWAEVSEAVGVSQSTLQRELS